MRKLITTAGYTSYIVLFFLCAFIGYLFQDIKIIKEDTQVLLRMTDRLNDQILDYRTQIIPLTLTLDKVNLKNLLRTSVVTRTVLGLGSGTIIRMTETDIYILTCYHCTIGSQYNKETCLNTPVMIGVPKEYVYDQDDYVHLTYYAAQIIKCDPEQDLALIKIYAHEDSLRVAPIAKKVPHIGDTVYTVGNPIGYVRSVGKGILSNIVWDISAVDEKSVDQYYLTDAGIIGGNSGGGLFNEAGELIGVPSQGYDGSPFNDAISLERIYRFLSDVVYE